MAEAKDKVSVVIPTYNRAELLMAAVKSLQEQSYQNIEIIIVDDCSTDSTSRVVERIKDDRIIYIRHEANKGGAEARNTGIKHASGNFIGFLDSDDQWLPEKLEKQLAVLEGGLEAGVVYTGIKVFLNNALIKEIIPKFKGDLSSKLIESNYIYTTSSILVRKELLERIGGFNSELPSCQDWDLYLRLAQISHFEFVSEALVLYNQHPGERISTNQQAVVDGHLQIYKAYNGLAQSKGAAIFQKFSFKIAKTIFRIGLISQDKEIVYLSREILVKSLARHHTNSQNVFLYFSTYANLKFLLYLHIYYERINTGYYSFSIRKSEDSSSQKKSVVNKSRIE